MKRQISFVCSTAVVILMFAGMTNAASVDNAYGLRAPEDEIIYLIMPDRFDNADRTNDFGGLSGDRLKTGYDPTSTGFYHGGDLKGVRRRLDYIQSLGATAVWLTPVFKNKVVQGAYGMEFAGYHGYWITDFTQIDPHLGTDADFKALVDDVHAHGMKFYMDIVVNHTADVIHYKECSVCTYRSRANYPYTRVGGIDGKPINEGFLGDTVGTDKNFAKLIRPDYAYTPYVTKGEEHIKVPAWLNDPIYYHNRGNSTFKGESSTMGEHTGLDDLFTENPRVIRGMIDIYGQWIDKYKIDGFRIDTEQHVNSTFWHEFIPAMQERAIAAGINNFLIFGEVMTGDADVALLARHTREDKLPAVMDYAFAAAIRHVVAENEGTQILARLFEDDVLYAAGRQTALRNTTLLGNYDIGRFGWFVRRANPNISDDEVLRRIILANAMMFTLRGTPVIYYGDEQGFPSSGNDQAAREDMFASSVQRYNEERLIGTSTTTATEHFGSDNPLFKTIVSLSDLRKKSPELSHGNQITRYADEKSGLFAVSRINPENGHEILVAFNTSTASMTVNIEINASSKTFASLHGTCPTMPVAPGSYRLALAPLDYVVCSAEVHEK